MCQRNVAAGRSAPTKQKHLNTFCLTYDPVKGRRVGDVNNIFLFLYNTKPIDTMLPCVCSVIDHRRCQNGGKNIRDTLVYHMFAVTTL